MIIRLLKVRINYSSRRERYGPRLTNHVYQCGDNHNLNSGKAKTSTSLTPNPFNSLLPPFPPKDPKMGCTLRRTRCRPDPRLKERLGTGQ